MKGRRGPAAKILNLRETGHSAATYTYIVYTPGADEVARDGPVVADWQQLLLQSSSSLFFLFFQPLSLCPSSQHGAGHLSVRTTTTWGREENGNVTWSSATTYRKLFPTSLYSYTGEPHRLINSNQHWQVEGGKFLFFLSFLSLFPCDKRPEKMKYNWKEFLFLTKRLFIEDDTFAKRTREREKRLDWPRFHWVLAGVGGGWRKKRWGERLNVDTRRPQDCGKKRM